MNDGHAEVKFSSDFPLLEGRHLGCRGWAGLKMDEMYENECVMGLDW